MNGAPSGLSVDRLPDIDYTKHPLYGRADRRVGLKDRILGYLRYAQIVGYLVGVRVHHWWTRRAWRESGATPHLESLSRDGIVPLRLEANARADVVAAAQAYFDRLDAHRKGIERGRRTYGDGQIDTTRDSAPELFAAVERALVDAGILASVRAYLGCRAEVRKVTVQMNDEWDAHWRAHFEDAGLPLPDTAFLHVDNTYGVVKVIIYVSEVTDTSGPFSYVPGTNRIEYGFLEGLLLRATDIWIDEWPQHRDLLLTLPRRFRKKAKFGDDIPADSDWGRWLLENEQFVTSVQGDMLLFDVMGIHRGGMIERGERRILQIMMR